MKFSHLADVHIGSWRDPKLNDISLRAFEKAMDMSIEREVDFILIAGDLFNTSLPSIDKLKGTVDVFKKLKNLGIPARFPDQAATVRERFSLPKAGPLPYGRGSERPSQTRS